MVTFDPQTGIKVSEVSEVREQVRAQWIKAFAQEGKPTLNTEPETPAGQLIDAQTYSIIEADNRLLFLANMFDPRKAQGIWQDALGKIYFLTRHPAVASTALITCTGRNGTFIPKGAQIRSIVDNTVWTCSKSVNIPQSGSVDVTFACDDTGPITAAPDTLTKIVTTIAGWDLATNKQAATPGQEEESQAAFEHRRYTSVALNSRSALESAYSRIAALDGVIAVCVRQNRSDNVRHIDKVALKPHSVFACVLGGKDEDIAQALSDTVALGCEYTGTTEIKIKHPLTRAEDTVRFTRPYERPLKILVTIRESDDINATTATDAIKNLIYQNFYGTAAAQQYSTEPVLRVVMGTNLYSSRFISALAAAGYQEVINLQMGLSPTEPSRDFIAIPINECPTLSLSDITIRWRPAYVAPEGSYFGFSNDDPNVTGFDQAPFATAKVPSSEDSDHDNSEDGASAAQPEDGANTTKPEDSNNTAQPEASDKVTQPEESTSANQAANQVSAETREVGWDVVSDIVSDEEE